jgi:hypothetical protein
VGCVAAGEEPWGRIVALKDRAGGVARPGKDGEPVERPLHPAGTAFRPHRPGQAGQHE